MPKVKDETVAIDRALVALAIGDPAWNAELACPEFVRVPHTYGHVACGQAWGHSGPHVPKRAPLPPLGTS